MFRSLHMKLVMILLLLITSLMAIVGAFMMTNITRFYIDEFYQQVEGVFGNSDPTNSAFVNSLRQEAGQEEGAVQTLQQMIEAQAGFDLARETREEYRQAIRRYVREERKKRGKSQ